MNQIKVGTSTGKTEKTIRQMKGKTERDMEIVILKNRNGKIGDELQFKYYAMFHHFKTPEKNDVPNCNGKIFSNLSIDYSKIKNI